jgi:tetratricopeptide (TPR) repeat protein
MADRFEHLEFDDEPPRLRTEQRRQEEPGVLRSEPMETHAYHQRAIQSFQRGDFEQAMRYFTRTLELDRGFVPAWVGQVQMLIELKELREADLWADKALELFRDQGELLSAKAVARTRLHDVRAALRFSDSALAARGASAYRWLARGEVLLASEQAKAAACFDRAMIEPDADWFTRLWIGRLYRMYGNHTQALMAARQATEQAPHAPYAWYIRGLCERDLAMGNYRSSLEHALEVDPAFVVARTALREPANASWFKRWYRRMRGA